MEIWDPKKELSEASNDIPKKVEACTNKAFPFLDMELYWNDVDKLNFKVHLKPNQQLKHLNNSSNHHKPCKKNIAQGVFTRLARLTTINDNNKNKSIKELYPSHVIALENAGLLDDDINVPTILEA